MSFDDKKEKVRKGMGGVAMILGGVPLLYSLWTLSDLMLGGPDQFSMLWFILSTFLLLIIVSLPALLVFCGWCFYRYYHESHLACCVGIPLTAIGILFPGVLLGSVEMVVAGGSMGQITLFISMLVMVIIYLVCMKLWVAYFTSEERPLRNFLSGTVIGCMAFLFWFALVDLDQMLISENGHSSYFSFFGIPVVFIAYYKITQWAGLRDKHRKKKQSDLLDLEPEA